MPKAGPVPKQRAVPLGAQPAWASCGGGTGARPGTHAAQASPVRSVSVRVTGSRVVCAAAAEGSGRAARTGIASSGRLGSAPARRSPGAGQAIPDPRRRSALGSWVHCRGGGVTRKPGADGVVPPAAPPRQLSRPQKRIVSARAVPSHGSFTVQGKGIQFTREDIDTAGRQLHMPLLSTADKDFAAEMLSETFASALLYSRARANASPRGDRLGFLKRVTAQVRLLLEILEITPDTTTEAQPPTQHLWFRHVSAGLYGNGSLSFDWCGLPHDWFGEFSRRACNAIEDRSSHSDSEPLSYEERGTVYMRAASREALLLTPTVLRTLCTIASQAQSRIKGMPVRVGNRSDLFSNVLFQGLFRVHRELFGNRLIISGRRGKSALWVEAILKVAKIHSRSAPGQWPELAGPLHRVAELKRSTITRRLEEARAAVLRGERRATTR